MSNHQNLMSKDFVTLTWAVFFLEWRISLHTEQYVFTATKMYHICNLNTNELCITQRKCLKVILRFWKEQLTDGTCTLRPVRQWLAACFKSLYALQAPGCQVVKFFKSGNTVKEPSRNTVPLLRRFVKNTAPRGAMLASMALLLLQSPNVSSEKGEGHK